MELLKDFIAGLLTFAGIGLGVVFAYTLLGGLVTLMYGQPLVAENIGRNGSVGIIYLLTLALIWFLGVIVRGGRGR